MHRVRLMTWCPRSATGMQLAAFAADEGGLFADRGLEVEFVPAVKPPDYSLPGFTARVKAVAAGHADFALTGVAYLLAAQTELAGALPVRFVATAHQHNPITAFVRADSALNAPADLPGARTARWSMPWFAQDYAGALEYLGLGAPLLIDTPEPLNQALGSGRVEVAPTWLDDSTQAQLAGMTLEHEGARFGIRAIGLDIPLYSTGLVAADRVPLDVVTDVRDAFGAGHELQRQRPELGVAGFRRFFPSVSAEYARANWALYAANAFDGAAPGSMSADRWRETISHTARTHGLASFPGERIYRPELLAPAPASATA